MGFSKVSIELKTSILFGMGAIFVLSFTNNLRFIIDQKTVHGTALGCVLTYWILTLITIWFTRLYWRAKAPFFLAAISIGMALAVTEVFIRLFFPYLALPKYDYGTFSKQYHHVNLPNRTMYQGKFNEKQVTILTNEHGFRTHHSLNSFRNADYKIAVLGDSFTFGLGVPQEELFAEILEKKLEVAYPGLDIAVLNAGVVSYSPFLAINQYRGIVQHYQPDLTLYVLDVTDIGDDWRYRQEATFGLDQVVRFNLGPEEPKRFYGAVHQIIAPYLAGPWKSISYPLTLVFSRPNAKQHYDYYQFKVEINGVTERNRFFIYRHPLKFTRKYFQQTLANLQQLAAMTNQFVLVLSPRYHHWDKKRRECTHNWEQSKYSRNESYQFEFFRFFEEEKNFLEFPVLNMLPHFLKTDQYPLVFDFDPHWNSKGHAFCADILAEYIRANYLSNSERIVRQK